jgi:hypothetical protein
MSDWRIRGWKKHGLWYGEVYHSGYGIAWTRGHLTLAGYRRECQRLIAEFVA